MNTIISIGYLGLKTCYLNIPIEEAKKRYLAANPDESDQLDKEGFIDSFTFKDQFSAYDVGDDPDRDSIVALVSGNSDGTDDSGNEYQLTSEEDETDESLTHLSSLSEDQVNLINDTISSETSAALAKVEEVEQTVQDETMRQLESRAKDLAYAIVNPATLSSKLRDELVSIVGPEAAVTYHLSASFDSTSQQVKFQVARLSPSTVFRLKSDLKTTEVGFAYIKTINGWRVAVGLTASAFTGDDPVTRVRAPQAGSVDASGSFSVTVSR